VGDRFLYSGVVLVLKSEGNSGGERQPKAVSLAKVDETAHSNLKVGIVGFTSQGEGKVFSLYCSGLGTEFWPVVACQLFQVCHGVRHSSRGRVSGNSQRGFRGTTEQCIEPCLSLTQPQGLGG